MGLSVTCYGIKGICRGKDEGSPQWPPQGTCSLPSAELWELPDPCGKGRSPPCCLQGSLGAVQPAGGEQGLAASCPCSHPSPSLHRLLLYPPWWFLNCPLRKLFHQTRLVTKPKKPPNSGEQLLGLRPWSMTNAELRNPGSLWQHSCKVIVNSAVVNRNAPVSLSCDSSHVSQ